MVDWRAVTGNALWIAGLSMLLAACSYANWLALVSRRPRLAVFSDLWFRLTFRIALSLTLIGWVSTQARTWWERAACVVLAGACGWDVPGLIRSRRRIDTR
jgi:hypothetical protein